MREGRCSDVYVEANTCGSVGHREQARASARTHTEEGNLSLTRILNGCAEARTVGTHYSTTHPPPLRQNSTSPLQPSLLTPRFPPHRRPRRSRALPLLNSSSLLSFSRSLASRAPCPPPFDDCFFPFALPSVPSLSLLSFSQHTLRASCFSVYTHIYMAKGIHM